MEEGLSRRLFHPYALLTGEGLELRLRERTTRDRRQGIRENIIYDICPPGVPYAGYVSLRLGESPEIFYLGHIGYRVEEPFRGQGLAARAVRALLPLMVHEGLRSLSITTDTDNLPSRKTCENLGCILESIVPVPRRYRALCMNSPAKCRYVLLVEELSKEGIRRHDFAG